MATKKSVHVLPDGQGWKVAPEGSARPISRHETQRDAIRAGRDAARAAKGELLVHGRNGRIRDRSTYGSDPRRSKG